MRQFYLSKNNYGYYRVNFIDSATGKKLPPKSTHTKDKIDASLKSASEMSPLILTSVSCETDLLKCPLNADEINISEVETSCNVDFQGTLIAKTWLEQGVTSFNANSRAFKCEVTGEKLPEVKTKNNSAVVPQSQNLQSFVDSLSQNDVNALIVMLAQKVQGGGVMPTMPISQTNVQVAQTTANVQLAVQPAIQNVVGLASENQNMVARQAEPASIANENRIPLISYMIDFWDFEKSKYLAEEKAYGRTISERHAKEMRGIANRYWKPYFGDAQVAQATT